MNEARHLDLGCGTRPTNPYGQPRLYGVDIRDGLTAPGVERIVAADLTMQPIPFEANFFDSVSAYDFLEHVPRVVPRLEPTPFPFVNLMNEIWRVLRPGGRFYAVTPVYPHEKVFRDPTHVNVLTMKTHRYFTQPYLQGRMYGFNGTFRLIRQDRIHLRGHYEPYPASIGRRLLRLADGLAGKRSHVVWEMEAVKPA